MIPSSLHFGDSEPPSATAGVGGGPYSCSAPKIKSHGAPPPAVLFDDGMLFVPPKRPRKRYVLPRDLPQKPAPGQGMSTSRMWGGRDKMKSGLSRSMTRLQEEQRAEAAKVFGECKRAALLALQSKQYGAAHLHRPRRPIRIAKHVRARPAVAQA